MFDTLFDEDFKILLNEAPEDNNAEGTDNETEELEVDTTTEDEEDTTTEDEEDNNPEDDTEEENATEEEPETDTNVETDSTEENDDDEEPATDESNQDTDANAEEMSKEKIELNHKKLHYFDCATEVLSTTNNFLIRIQDSYSKVEDEKKYMLSQIEQSLLKEKADLYILIHDKINQLEPDAINKVLVIFITKIETLCDLVEKILETEE